MPYGVYIRTAEHRHNMSLAHKGKKLSEKHVKSLCAGSKSRWSSSAGIEEKQKHSIFVKRWWSSPETKLRMSIVHRGHIDSFETRQKKSIQATKQWNSSEGRQRLSVGKDGHAVTLQTRQKISISKKGKHPSSDTRQKMSIMKSQLILDGIFRNGRGNGGYFYSKKNDAKLWYRSSYELQAYKILEQLSEIEKYKVEPFYISYEFQGTERHYIPDIIVTYGDGTEEIIEIMSEWQSGDEKRIAKLSAGREYCNKKGIKFSIWTERELVMKKIGNFQLGKLKQLDLYEQ